MSESKHDIIRGQRLLSHSLGPPILKVNGWMAADDGHVIVSARNKEVTLPYKIRRINSVAKELSFTSEAVAGTKTVKNCSGNSLGQLEIQQLPTCSLLI